MQMILPILLHRYSPPPSPEILNGKFNRKRLFKAFPNSTYHKASRIPSVYPSTPHPEIVGVAKPPSSNLYSMSDPNLIYAPPPVRRWS
ncbi:hypothetical protein CEXT_609861 [Caerostris extrusa]|uniref:Uncharacterized protein n=1 Tax=Caerostris extrusa TaxID=172846 RepID=A0AAV4NSS1_CAEEX|nr:hypothetical protein CEXT_609861 [Caerostris extrusa]